jgi:transposase
LIWLVSGAELIDIGWSGWLALRVVVKRTQLKTLVRERNQGASITMSAMKAGMSRNTARKYLRQGEVTEQRRVPHTWRTRPDPLEAIWPTALEMLREAPELEAKALFEHLRQGHEERMAAGLLRTFQRRVRRWRLMEGQDKEVFFTQDHRPGEVLAVDWTEMSSLGISIGGRSFSHCQQASRIDPLTGVEI